MFYILRENNVKKTEFIELDSNEICVGFLTVEELNQSFDSLGIKKKTFLDCMYDQTHLRTSIDTYDDFSFGIINIVYVMDVHKPKDRVAFIIKKNLFLLVKLVDEDNSCKDMIENAVGRLTQKQTLGKVVSGVFESLLLNGNKPLEITERKILNMEQQLVNGRISEHLNRDIFNLRKDLSILKNYYEQLFNIGEELQENQNNLFEEDDLRYFRIFTVKSERLSNNTQLLSENLIHLREALDASLNYSLNKTMQFFTVVTTIFLPLTLIVGWYGMNFTNMPELTWKYGYVTVIIVCMIVVGICLYLFKRKKYF
ncbi:magnesium transporter [Lachnotalea glycerini]|jgi:magnesium transporter|uniref:Magnesium transporter n=1 Tax=Lachnotalea glycerini TaxID=1763509 RepID=A0A255ISC7_9FIRM|nr:CorA family divalent cation transporter [Lachnotalea glycerini]PXV93270.1 magnesium transporter [Lachnotalea glycerini]RDY31911.1 hypothetical protein CG710_007130 [Lachnotalea glycerini]